MSKITDSDPQKNLSIIKLKEISKDQEYAALMFFFNSVSRSTRKNTDPERSGSTVLQTNGFDFQRQYSCYVMISLLLNRNTNRAQI